MEKLKLKINNMNKELFTAEQMIEFANCFSYASEKELISYKDMLKQRKEQEYQLYLTLKAKYE
jgi:hypothetical protein